MAARGTGTVTCRYAADPLHRCERRDGRAPQGDEPCFASAFAEVREQGAVLRAAEQIVTGDEYESPPAGRAAVPPTRGEV